MAYQVTEFLENVEKHKKATIEKAQTTYKHELIGEIVSSLQQPFKDLMNIVSNVTREQYLDLKKIEEANMIYEKIKFLSDGKTT